MMQLILYPLRSIAITGSGGYTVGETLKCSPGPGPEAVGQEANSIQERHINHRYEPPRSSCPIKLHMCTVLLKTETFKKT